MSMVKIVSYLRRVLNLVETTEKSVLSRRSNRGEIRNVFLLCGGKCAE